jgi:hypothetical protein
MRGEVGTVLGPLADEIGTSIAVLGTLLTLLLLGLGIERTSVAVMNMVAEWLPGRRRLLPVLTPLAVCAVGEVLLGADLVTFSGVFAVAGVATNILLAIALPLLLVLAARRSGDVQPEPGARAPLCGRPAAIWAIVGFAALLLAAFATVLTDELLLRVGATVSLLALAGMVALAARTGAFAARRPSAREG